MRTSLNPIMFGVLAAFATPAVAIEHGRIDLTSPGSTNVSMVLNNGDTVTYSGAGPAIWINGSNTLTGDGVAINAAGASQGILVAGSGVASLSNSSISKIESAIHPTDGAPAVVATLGGRIDWEGGSVTVDNRDGVQANEGSTITLKDVIVTVSTSAAATSPLGFTLGSGVEAIGAGAHLAMERGKIVVVGDDTVAVRAGHHGAVSLRDTDIFSDGSHEVARATVLVTWDGTFEMNGGSIKATNDAAIGVAVATDRTVPALPDTANASLTGVKLALDGDAAIALSAGGLAIVPGSAGLQHGGMEYAGGGKLTVFESEIELSGKDAVGVLVGNQSVVTLDNTRIGTEGAGAFGILGFSSLVDRQDPTVTVIRNGTRISTQDAAALATQAGSQTFMVSDSIITGRASGQLDGGVLLRATAQNGLKSEQVVLDATNSFLTGDIMIEEGRATAHLKNGSVLTGALVQRGAGRISELAVDGASTWRVRGDSSLGTLTNAGLVAFAAPAAGAGFKTVTVNNYVGAGTLEINTRLGGDSSPADKLIIDGGSASGDTALRVVNAGGEGGKARAGIRVVQTVNGGTTGADAFRLDAGSTGYRPSADMLSLNGYDYALMRGGNGGNAQDWYLAYNDAPIAPLTGESSYKNVSPESGAYVGNQLAATRLFTHGLYDRVSSYAGDAAASRGRGVWTRVQGRRDSGQRLSEGQVDITTDSSVLQLGVDLLKADVGTAGALYAGLMGGYGDARVRSISTLVRPTGSTVQARTDGKVSGYSVGVYGTYYQDDATRLGAYADTWLQWGRYNNQLNSELGSARYHSTVVSASLEAGYALTPFAPGSTLGPLVLQPHVQMTYSRYGAADATLQGTRMRSGNNDTLDSRLGVRVYPQATAGAPAVRPFLEANWLHGFGNPSAKMGGNVIDAQVARNNLELKLGAEGYAGRAVKMSGHVFGQAGNNNQRGYGGMVNMAYRW